jgi:predicted ester cyclase
MSTYSPAVERNLRVVDAFLAGTHSGDPKGLEVIDATVADSIVCHGFPGRNPTDRASYKAFFRAFQGAFNDMKFRADQTVADEDFVAVRWSMQVNHVGEFAGVAPGGRRIDVTGMVMYRMKDGLIAETWLHIDEAGLLRQIGAQAA